MKEFEEANMLDQILEEERRN